MVKGWRLSELGNFIRHCHICILMTGEGASFRYSCATSTKLIDCSEKVTQKMGLMESYFPGKCVPLCKYERWIQYYNTILLNFKLSLLKWKMNIRNNSLLHRNMQINLQNLKHIPFPLHACKGPLPARCLKIDAGKNGKEICVPQDKLFTQ